MNNLMELYENIKNPIDASNKELKKLLIVYYCMNSRLNTRISTASNSYLYDSLVENNHIYDKTKINLKDREKFWVDTYNQWIENYINLNNEQIQLMEKNGIQAKKVQNYLKKVAFVSSMSDIEKLESNPLLKGRNGLNKEKFEWKHIKSKHISAYKEKEIDVKHRLYIGTQNQDTWKMARLFKEKCEKNNIPFYFKVFDGTNSRDDKIVIYGDTTELLQYVKILKQIAKENPAMIKNTGKPPYLTGKIDNWIGIGDEPEVNENGKKQSYNTLRANIIEKAMEETTINGIRECLNKNVMVKEHQYDFNDLFLTETYKIFRESIEKNALKAGIPKDKINSPKFEEYIKNQLLKKIPLGLDKLDELRSKEKQSDIKNLEDIFSINITKNSKMSFNTVDMDRIVKKCLYI